MLTGGSNARRRATRGSASCVTRMQGIPTRLRRRGGTACDFPPRRQADDPQRLTQASNDESWQRSN